MSQNADELEIEDVTPPQEAPVAEPVEAPETPTPETKETPEVPSPAPTDKGQQQDPTQQWIPKWRFDEVNERYRAALQQQQQPRPAPQAPQAQGEPEPTQEQYQTYEAYVEARAEFRARQTARAEFQNLQTQAIQSQQARSFQERVEKADTDWNTELYAATQKNPALLQKLSNAPGLRPDLQLVLKESNARVALAEHLADNPAMVFQLNQMPPDRAIWTMSEAAFKLTAVTGGPQKKPSAQAPNLDPVGGGNKPAKKNPYSADASVEDFIFGTAKLPGR
jgi:hypothetical protein